MPSDSKFTRDDDGNVAVRVVSNTGVSEQPESMFTTDEDGNVAVRVVFGEGGGGGGGSDQHNLGWYATQAALEEAHPTAEAGDWAIVGATDTVWIWDTDNSEWVDSDQKGQVTSVNNRTGAVTVSEVPSQTGNAGKFLTTNGTDASWGTTINGVYKNIVTFSGYVPMFESLDNSNNSKFLISYSTSGYSGSIVFRDSDANYKAGLTFANNGSSNKLIYPIGSGFSFGNPNAPWENIYTKKFNNGSDITVPNATGEMVVNKATGTESLSISGNVATGMYDTNVGYRSSASGNGAAFGFNAVVYNGGVACGRWAQATGQSSTAVGNMATAGGSYSVAIGCEAKTTANYAIQISSKYGYTNADTNTFKVGNNNGNFEIMSADGTIPADRLKNAINKYSTMPTAASTNEGWIVQFTGTTDSTYTHGHLYECVSDGGNPATYSWTEVSMGGSSLPSQTGNAGKFLTTDGTDASWSDKPLVNNATGTDAIGIGAIHTVSGEYAIGIGRNAKATAQNAIAIGTGVTVQRQGSIGAGAGVSMYGQDSVGFGRNVYVASGCVSGVAIGCDAGIGASNAIQISAHTYGGGPNVINSDANTFKVANANGNFEMMSADGTIPHARLVNAVSSTSVTIATTDWSSNTASVTVSGLTATSVVWVAPDNTSQSAYTTAGVYASAQAADTLTFTCTQTPSASLTINVVFC